MHEAVGTCCKSLAGYKYLWQREGLLTGSFNLFPPHSSETCVSVYLTDTPNHNRLLSVQMSPEKFHMLRQSLNVTHYGSCYPDDIRQTWTCRIKMSLIDPSSLSSRTWDEQLFGGLMRIFNEQSRIMTLFGIFMMSEMDVIAREILNEYVSLGEYLMWGVTNSIIEWHHNFGMISTWRDYRCSDFWKIGFQRLQVSDCTSLWLQVTLNDFINWKSNPLDEMKSEMTINNYR